MDDLFSDEELDQLEPGWLKRCEWCGWPLGPREKGCAEGDCSQRPRPRTPMSRWKETVRRLAKTEPEDIDKLVTVCRMNAMASSPHVALTHLTIAGTLLALRDEVERLRVSIARCANEIENSAGVNSAPFADMVRKILEDSAK